MATSFRETMAVPASVAVGAELDVRRASQKAVQTSGTFVATYDIQGTVDGTTFEDVTGGSGLTAPALVQIPDYYQKLRINVSAHTSGAIVAVAAGIQERG